MSLLMDALKRAEENKQGLARQGESAPPIGEAGLSLEPLNAAGTPLPQSLPDLAAHLDAVDADLAAAVPPRAPRETEASADRPAAREAARTVFDAKLPIPPSRAPLYITFAVLGIGALAIGTYFWWQLQSLSPSSLNRPVAARPAPPASRPAALPTAPNPPPPPGETITAAPLPAVAPTAQFGAKTPALAVAANDGPALRLTRSRNEIDGPLIAGWNQLQSGSLEAARREYEKAWQNDPKSVDAILGLAAVAQRQGRADDAERLQQLALIADPKDAAAQAANLAPLSATDPQGAESRLKTLLAEQPQSGALNFALGNLYARQGRWGEAQQAYFNAFTADGEHPDYLFNLAISLDRLRQPRLAAQYYRQALDAAGQRPPSFAPEQARRRLQQLTVEATQP